MFRMMQQFAETCNISADVRQSLADEISTNDRKRFSRGGAEAQRIL